MFVLTSDQIRQADEQTIQHYGIPSIVLMENAASGLVDAMMNKYPDARKILVLAGKGNNGGDGLAAARQLHNRGLDVEVLLFATLGSLKGDAGRNLRIARRMGVPVTSIRSARQFENSVDRMLSAQVIVDALFGTGLSKPLTGLYAEVVATLNALRVPVVSVDVPSGLSGSSGEIIGPAVIARLTATFGALKVPHVFPPASDYAGEVVVVDIGIPYEVLEGISQMEILSGEEFAPLLAPRPRDAHKGTFGHVAIVAGSRDKPGAAAMAALSAYRVGAGLVTVVSVPEVIRTTIGIHPEVMGLHMPEDGEGHIHSDALPTLLEFCDDRDAVLIGPGLGTSEPVQDMIRTFVMGLTRPAILDADALTAFSGKLSRLTERKAPTVLTPHPGEMGRLTGKSTEKVQQDRVSTVRDACIRSKAVTLLKGFQTLVAVPGGKVFVNPTGNPGMATGGTGDVLGGMIAGFAAQGHSPDVAALLGTFFHGLAGDAAAEEKGEASLTAGDVADYIPRAFQWLKEPS